jgi:hypothetical protein
MPAILDATQMERGPLKTSLRYSVPDSGPQDGLLVIHLDGDFHDLCGFSGGEVDIEELVRQCPGVLLSWMPRSGKLPAGVEAWPNRAVITIHLP